MDKEESSKVEDKGQNMYEMKCKLNCYQPLTLQWGWEGPGISYPDDLGKDMGESYRHFLKKSNQIQLDFSTYCLLT